MLRSTKPTPRSDLRDSISIDFFSFDNATSSFGLLSLTLFFFPSSTPTTTTNNNAGRHRRLGQGHREAGRLLPLLEERHVPALRRGAHEAQRGDGGQRRAAHREEGVEGEREKRTRKRKKVQRKKQEENRIVKGISFSVFLLKPLLSRFLHVLFFVCVSGDFFGTSARKNNRKKT